MNVPFLKATIDSIMIDFLIDCEYFFKLYITEKTFMSYAKIFYAKLIFCMLDETGSLTLKPLSESVVSFNLK